MAKKRLEWLDPRTVLTEAGGLKDDRSGWKRYLGHLEFLATDAQAKRDLVFEKLSRGWCVGSKSFRQALQKETEETARFVGLGPQEVRVEREQAWEEKLQALARGAKVDLGTLSSVRSHPDKTLLAAAMKQSTSVSNGWLAERLAMGQPASASQFVRRRMLDKEGKAAVERLLSRVKT